MKTRNTILILSTAAILYGCKEELAYEPSNMAEIYTKAFINKFGKPAENHPYNVAVAGAVTVISSIPRDIKVLAVIDGEEYMFADYHNVRGREVIDFDIPQGFEHLKVYTNGTSVDANLGDVIDLDNPFVLSRARSRADDDIIRTYERISFSSTEKYYGYVSPIDDNFHLKNTQSAYRITGCQLKNYFDRATTEYLENTPGYTDNRVVGNTYTTSGQNAVGVMYWSKKADEEFEFGLVYPQESDNNFNSGPLVYVPLYRTDESPSGEAPVQLYNYSHQNNLMGAEITIDFANKTQQITSAKWVQQGFADFYRNLFDDNGHLEALVEKQYNAQSNMLNPADYYSGVSPILPPYSSGVMDFYEKWDEFVYATLTDAQKAQMDEIEPLKNFFGWNRMKMPYEHVYPKVTRDSSNPRKYKIYYMTAQYCNSYGLLKNNGTKAFDIVDHEVYAHDVYKIYPSDGSNKTYAYYVRNLKTGAINTTIDDDGKTIAHTTYIAGNMNTTGGQHIIEMDINDDGVYDDIVFYSNGKPVPTSQIEFTPYTWTIACEDLGNTDDWDFNDMVVQIQYIANNLSTQTIKIWPMAAGGIYPIYLMYTDPLESIETKMIGTELHRWLGRDDLTMYNTTGKFNSANTISRSVEMSYDINLHDSKKFSLTELNNSHWQTNNIGGFWVMVDKNDHYASIAPSQPGVTDFNRVFTDAEEWGDLDLINTCARANDNRTNLVPMVICVGKDWEWPSERSMISSAYPGWSNWIADPNFIWYGPALKDSQFLPNRNLVIKRN